MNNKKKNILFVTRTVYDNPFSSTLELKFRKLSNIYNCYFFAMTKQRFYKRYNFFCDFYLLKDISWIFFIISGLLFIPYIIKKKKIDTVIFQSPYELPILLLCKFLFYKETRLVVEMHGDMEKGLKFYGKNIFKVFLGRIFTRYALKFSDKIRLVSPYQLEQNHTLKKYLKKIIVFPAFMDLDSFSGISNKEKEFDVLFVGVLEAIKNLEFLIDVINDIKKQREVSLLIIGEGSQRRYLQDYVKRKNLSESVSFKGNLNKEELRGFYKKTKLLVLPSKYEGFGRVVCEAVVSGAEVLFSENCGVKSYFPDECCFYDKDDLKNKIENILKKERKNKVIYNIKQFYKDNHFFKGMKSLVYDEYE